MFNLKKSQFQASHNQQRPLNTCQDDSPIEIQYLIRIDALKRIIISKDATIAKLQSQIKIMNQELNTKKIKQDEIQAYAAFYKLKLAQQLQISSLLRKSLGQISKKVQILSQISKKISESFGLTQSKNKSSSFLKIRDKMPNDQQIGCNTIQNILKIIDIIKKFDNFLIQTLSFSQQTKRVLEIKNEELLKLELKVKNHQLEYNYTKDGRGEDFTMENVLQQEPQGDDDQCEIKSVQTIKKMGRIRFFQRLQFGQEMQKSIKQKKHSLDITR